MEDSGKALFVHLLVLTDVFFEHVTLSHYLLTEFYYTVFI